MKKGNIVDIRSIIEDDLEAVDVKSLENNPKLLVKLISMNYRLYFYCSKEIRQNYDFVIDVIEACKDDIEFIEKVADEFLAIDLKQFDEEEKNKKALDKNAIAVLMQKYTYSKPNGNYLKYHSIACSSFYSNHDKVNRIIEKNSDKTKDYYKLGFRAHEIFFNNEIVLEFTASMLIDKIFYQLTNIERELHKKYDSKDKLLEVGLTNLLINKINQYDNFLAGYVLSHPTLLEKLKEKANEILDNWDEYNRQIQTSKNNADKIVEQIDKYFEEEVCQSTVSKLTFLVYFAKQYDIQEEICEAYKKRNKKAKIEVFNFIKDYEEDTLYLAKYLHHQGVFDTFYDVYHIFEDNMEDICKNPKATCVEYEVGKIIAQRKKDNDKYFLKDNIVGFKPKP